MRTKKIHGVNLKDGHKLSKEEFEFLLDADMTGANLPPMIFAAMDEYERENFCGLGVHIHIQQRPVRVEFLYERTDPDDGEKVFMGISLTLTDPSKVKTVAEYEEAAKRGEERGFPSMNISAGELRRITVEEYEREYQEDEGEKEA